MLRKLCAGLLYLFFSCPLAAEELMYVAVDTANVRDDPDGEVLSKLRRGADVVVFDTSGDWSRISEMNASPEWVSSSLLCDAVDCWKVAGRSNATGSARYSGQAGYAAPPPRVATTAKYSSGRKARGTTLGRGSKRSRSYDSGSGCPCSGRQVCIGPRGGRYCITSGGNKRYGV